jgi:26S proteasome non-ATPase regulatory subunit 9
VRLRVFVCSADGFPRSDVDIYAIRTARHRLACLQTDYKQVMEEMKIVIEALHAQASEPGAGAGAGSVESKVDAERPALRAPAAEAPSTAPPTAPLTAAAAIASVTAPSSVAIALVGSVSAGSPAATAGFLAGDEVLRFGSLTASNTFALSTIGDFVRRNVGVAVSATVRRSGAVETELVVTPGVWGGPGMLGMHLLPRPEA